jgi:hypothetical protein
MDLAAQADGAPLVHGGMGPYQQANACASQLPFSKAATATANGDWTPARELCAREHDVHGIEWALELWDEINEAIEDARGLDASR